MPKWTTFPHTGDYTFDAASAKKQWARLHTGDAEPLPKDAWYALWQAARGVPVP